MRIIRRLVFALIGSALVLLAPAPAVAAPLPAHWTHRASITNIIVLGENSHDAPALWTAGDAVFAPAESTAKSILAWTGTNSGRWINLMLSHNGLDYTNKLVLPFSALARSAVLVAHAA